VRVVLDTNILLAAFAARGLCEALLQACLESCRIVLSEHILKELHEHLTRKLKVPARQVESIIVFLREQAEIVAPAKVPGKACRDKDDLPVLGTALAGNAEFLVTGDKDLLALKHYQGIPIVGPRAFYDQLQK
jgi:putative PIN family toxin of toxin-antitoxin system